MVVHPGLHPLVFRHIHASACLSSGPAAARYIAIVCDMEESTPRWLSLYARDY